MSNKISRWLARLAAGKTISAKAMATLVSLGLIGGTAVCAVEFKTPTASNQTPPPKKDPIVEVCAPPKQDNCAPVIHNVPDGGSTLALMGMGIATVGGLGWRFRRD